MKTTLIGMLRHIWIRFRAILTDPAAFVMILFMVGITLVYWPGPTDSNGLAWEIIRLEEGAEGDPYAIFLGLLWVWMWPVIPLVYAKGRVAGYSGADAFGMRALPSLPLGARSRIVAEVIVVLIFLVLGRLPGLFFPEGKTFLVFAAETLLGFVLVLPVLLTYALPSPSIEVLWVRSCVMVGLLLIALKVGLLGTPATFVATCLVLSTLPLFLVGRDASLPRFQFRTAGTADSRFRKASPPETQFKRDLWVLPFRRYGILMIGLLMLEGVVLILDLTIQLPGMSFYIATMLIFVSIGTVTTLKPLGDDLLAQSWAGKKGTRFGDFGKAWAVLPVRTSVVHRGIYLHGLLSSLALWIGVVLLLLLRTYLRSSTWELQSADGESVAMFVIPTVVMVPCMSGFLLSTAAGNKLRAILSGGALLALFQLPTMGLVISSQFFPRGSAGPRSVALAILVTLALIGSLPPLTLLKRRKEGKHPIYDPLKRTSS